MSYKEFQIHILNEVGKKNAREISEAFDRFLYSLAVHCVDSPREYALVRTKLEEACFFAKKAMANQTINQEVPGKKLC